MSLLRSITHYLPSFRGIFRCFLSTFSGRIFSLLFIVMYCTACSALLHTTFLTLRSDLLTKILFYFARLFSLSVMFSLWSYLPHIFTTCLHSALLQSDNSHQLCLILSAFSNYDLLKSDCSVHALICLLQSAWVSLIISALSSVPLDLLINSMLILLMTSML